VPNGNAMGTALAHRIERRHQTLDVPAYIYMRPMHRRRSYPLQFFHHKANYPTGIIPSMRGGGGAV